MDKKRPFCPVPWSELSTTPTGEWRMCCYANKFPDMTVRSHTPMYVHLSERMNKIRKAMIDGRQAVYEPFCERCIVMEQQGQTSRRQKRWEAVSADTCHAIEETKINGAMPFSNIEHFDIKFTGNKCNLRCYMCHPFYSSGVALEWKKMGWWNGPRHINPFTDLDEKEETQWWVGFEEVLPDIKVLNFTGGEPFLMDEYWQIIEFAINSGYSTGMELHLSSNMTNLLYRGRSVMDYFERFKHVHVQASVDAFGPQYNYIRYPGGYSAVMDNCNRVFSMERVDLQVTVVVSALSVFSLPALLEDMDIRGFPFRFDNVLTEPKYMRVSSLPMEAKRRLRYVLTDERFDGILPLLDEPENLDHWEQLKVHLGKLDEMRGTDWRREFPLLGEVA